MGVIASASKVLFDLTDSGRLFVTITANHLRTQVKETDVSGNASLVPDWKANNLVLTPVVYFDQQKIDLSSSYLSINWSKRVQNAAGADEIAALDSKTEKVSAAQKTLTISDNLLTGATNGMIAYRATITYTVGSVSFTDTAEMEFTLIEDGRDGEKGDKGDPGKNGEKGDKGDKGDPGESIASITNYYLASASASGVTTSTSDWKEAVQTTSESKPYLWNYEVVKGSNGTILNTTAPCIIGRYSKDGARGEAGRGIASITEHYQVSSSNTTAPTTWSDKPVNTTATNKYLWNYETITYTDGATEDSTKRVIGTHGEPGAKGDTGDNGRGVEKTYPQYHVYSSADTAPADTSAGWQNVMPAWQRGVYLWVRTATEYTDGSIEYSVPTCDATWETVLDAVSDLDVLKGQWAKMDTDGSRVLTTDDLLEGYAINLYITKDIPQFTQEGSGYPSSSNIRRILPFQGFTIHQTGCTLLPALDAVEVTKSKPATIELPYAIPAGNYVLSGVFSAQTVETTVELYTSDGNSFVAMDGAPSISSATPTKTVIARSTIVALRVSVASSASASYKCTVTNLRLVPVGCADDGREPRHAERFITIPEVVGGGVLDTEYQRILADWVIIPDLWGYTASFGWSNTGHGGGSGGAPYPKTTTVNNTPPSTDDEEEEIIEDDGEIIIGGSDIEIGGGSSPGSSASNAVGSELVRLNTTSFDALWTANLSEARMPQEQSDEYYFSGNPIAPIADRFAVASSHMQPTILQDIEWHWGYYPSSVKDKICASSNGANGELFLIRPESWSETYNSRDWVRQQSEAGTPIQVAIRPASPVTVYAGRTPKLTSFHGRNNIWVEGGATTFRIAGASDIASITDAIAKLQERQDAIRDATISMEKDIVTLQTKTASVDLDDNVWTTTTVGLAPGEFDATIAAYTDATGIVEKSMTLDPEGLKIHGNTTDYYTIFTTDGFEVRRGYAKATDGSVYTDPDNGDLPTVGYFNKNGEWVNTPSGAAEYTVKASFRADGAYIPQIRVTDVLSMGASIFGWYDVAVVGGGLGFVWRDGASGYILVQPTDCQVSGTTANVYFRVTAANIAEYHWQVATATDSNGFYVWKDVTGEPSAQTANLNYQPTASHYDGGARWRCRMVDATGATLYTNACIAIIRR